MSPRAPKVNLKDLPAELRQHAREMKRTAARQAQETFVRYCRLNGLPLPKPEHRFHPIRQWRIDFAFVDRKVALEVEGGVWTEGGHTRGSGFMDDIEKYNAAAVLGWRLIRCTPEQLYEPALLVTLRDILTQPENDNA